MKKEASEQLEYRLICFLLVDSVKRNTDRLRKLYKGWKNDGLKPIQGFLLWAFYEGFKTAQRIYKKEDNT